MELRYLYVGTSDTSSDLAAWLGVDGAKARWRFRAFGADVAAVDLGSPPVVLVADHRPPGSILPIYAVVDLEGTVATLAEAGWVVEASGFGTPEGPAAVLQRPGGATIALLRVERPDAMPGSYADPSNTHAVHPASS